MAKVFWELTLAEQLYKCFDSDKLNISDIDNIIDVRKKYC